MRPRRIDRELRQSVIALYRRCLRLTGRLEYEHQSTWYEYTKIKFRGNRDMHDPSKIKGLMADAVDEIGFVEQMLNMKKK